MFFFPYFFSVPSLSKTLFYPWKNLAVEKTAAGFAFNEWFGRACFNLISRGIGFTMRISILAFYILFQTMFLIFLPAVALAYLIIIPLLYVESLFGKTAEEKEKIIKTKFISRHLQKEENRLPAENWFADYYREKFAKKSWWKISNLFLIPPLARDWAVGYTPNLDQYVIDLASSLYQKKLKNIVDREKEIAEIERSLLKTEGSNILVVGEAGIGKHTIVDALAKKIYEGKTNPFLLYKRLLKLNLEKILTRYTDQKQRENFLEELLEEAVRAGNIILFIEDFDKYITAVDGRIDLTIPFEKFAKTASVQIIGITTPFHYQKFILTNGKLSQLFTKVDVFEVGRSQAEKILLNAAIFFEQKYKLIIPYETVENTLEKSDFYITYIPFPEKAIELLDDACVYTTQLGKSTVIPEVVDKVLTEKTHTPTILTSDLKQKLIELETLLKSQIIEQDEAVIKLSSAVRRSFLLIGKRKRPLASFLFFGPTGVGKTATAKAVAQIFFGSLSRLIRFDMSEYQSKTDIARLIGEGVSGNPGLLSSSIRENPYGVLLLDEIEKADHDLINIFLTVIDEGYFTDGAGKRVDCKNLVIIATSNAPTVNVFSPEFLNRFDGIVTFKSLSPEAIIAIAKKMLEKIGKDIFQLHKVTLKVSSEYLNALVQKSYDPKFGARNLERLISEEIEDKVAKMILADKVKEGDVISLVLY